MLTGHSCTGLYVSFETKSLGRVSKYELDLKGPYIPHPADTTWTFNGGALELISTMQSDHRGYELETGPAPPGYIPERVCYSLSGKRPCNGPGWVKCEVYERTENNVALEFKLQGDGWKPLQGQATVKVTYELNKASPLLF
jgi:hypothetical protein